MNDIFANLFELFGYCNAADDLYETMLYQTNGIIMLALSATAVALYYYILDSPRYVKSYHWAVWGLVTASLTLLSTWFLTSSTFANEGLDYFFSDYANFVIGAFAYSLMFFFIFSLLFKWKSPNRRRTPF